jgi:hypothetical protein
MPFCRYNVRCILWDRKHHLSAWLLERHGLMCETYVRDLDHRSAERNIEQRGSFRSYIASLLVNARSDFAQLFQNWGIPPLFDLEQ